jgi:nucleolin
LFFKKGAKGSWGEKANDVLRNTKGKSFRHEKTKKKRGSYRGGKIDTSTYSIRFSDSEN